MWILTNILSVFTADIRTTVISLIIALIIYKLSKFYVKVYSLPPGPIPLPFIGNVLFFRGTKEHWSLELEKVAQKYGQVFTMWMGTFPIIFISDIDLARDAFRKTEFAGRPDSVFASIFNYGDVNNIVNIDWGQKWATSRRIGHSAILKYSSSEKLVSLANDEVDQTISTMVEKEGMDKPFKPYDYIVNTFLNILATSAIGQRYELDDPEFKQLKYMHVDLFHEMSMKFLFWEMIPISRLFDFKLYSKLQNIFAEHILSLKDKFQSHQKDFDESVIRDFCDTLISSKNDALREGKESVAHLNDGSLAMVLLDLFFAGTTTSQSTFRWLLFFMAYYPEVFKKLRVEIESQIGDRIPTHEDREHCHYVMGFISETMRLRNVVPIGLVHKAVVTSKIGDYTIAKGDQVAVFQSHILRKEEYWENPKEFKPERFIEDGKLIRPKAFIPFGVGRRVCLGEKLALADLFLVVVRFVQKTAQYKLTLHYSGDTEPDPNYGISVHPKDYEISLSKN